MRDGQSVLSDRLQRLLSEMRAFQSALPDTPKNRARIAKTNKDSAVVAANLARGGLDLVKINIDFMGTLRKVDSDLQKARSVRDVRRVLESEQKAMESASRANARQLISIVTSFREIGAIAESLVDSGDSSVGAAQDAR